jgi:hypothetical protein
MISDWVGKLKKKRADPNVHFKPKKGIMLLQKNPTKDEL